MQPKYTHNKSNIIKITEEAKRKSRQRLIGSIILLFFALLILLNVTAKVKPIPINPEIVEVKNITEKVTESFTSVRKSNASGQIAAVASSAPVAASSAPLAASLAPPAIAVKQNASVTKKAGFKAGVVNSVKNNSAAATANDQDEADNPDDTPVAKPTPKPKAKKPVNPADILDGLTDNPDQDSPAQTTSSGHSYIQFAALSSAAKANKLQQALAEHGINATVQAIQTTKGTLYRLRAGPYPKADAQDKQQQMLDAGYNGIVTGK